MQQMIIQGDHFDAAGAAEADRAAALKRQAPSLRHRRVAYELAPDFLRMCDGVAAVGIGLLMLPAVEGETVANNGSFFVFMFGLTYILICNYAALYSVKAILRPLSHIDRIAISVPTAFLFVNGFTIGVEGLTPFSTTEAAAFLALFAGVVISARLLAWQTLQMLFRGGRAGRNMAVLGTGAQGQRLLEKMRGDPPALTRIVGAYATEKEFSVRSIHGFPVCGALEALLADARAGNIDDVIVALPWSSSRAVVDTIETLKELPISVHLSADLVGFDLAFQPVVGEFSELTTFKVVQRPISGWGFAVKSVFDVVCASLILVLLTPLLALIALAVRLDSPGPALFLQKRLGFNNQPFHIYKFRSMRQRASAELLAEAALGIEKQAQRDDPRVTRVGRIIRATSLDELPQLLNVLNGTMSLIGPRPHAMSHNEQYGAAIRGYFARHKVKPGITGWAQVNGLRGETDTIEKMQKRIHYDVYYVENWSFFFDIRILLMTVSAVLMRRNAY